VDGEEGEGTSSGTQEGEKLESGKFQNDEKKFRGRRARPKGLHFILCCDGTERTHGGKQD